MAVKIIGLGRTTGVNSFSMVVPSGDTLIVMVSEKGSANDLAPGISLSVNPTGSCQGSVYTSFSPRSKIIADNTLTDTTIQWNLSSTLAAVTTASTVKSDVFGAPVNAVKITATSGGSLVAEGAI